jgi:opacity protein-like surface antigen
MKRLLSFFICLLISAGVSAFGQVSESANVRTLTITAGGFVSGFQPDNGAIGKLIPGSAPDNYLIGAGTYVDLHFTRWIQIEGEARWLRFNEYYGGNEDTYLIGPKVPIRQFGRATAYGKAMIGLGKMNFPLNAGHGSFTALAYGGGIDYKLSRRLSLRAIDFEYQQWPKWVYNTSLYPYGVSVGVGYRVF